MTSAKRPILSLPCKKEFNDLASTERGFHCDNCDKVLTDFRGKPNDEVVHTIRTAEHKICGIFNPGQFDFKTSQLSFSASRRRVGLSLLGILGFLGPVMTSCSDNPQDDGLEMKQQAFNNLKFPMNVEGTLKDEQTGEPLRLKTVSIFQNGKVIRSGQTDASGYFRIVLEKGDLIRENFDFIVKQKGQSDTLKAFVLGKTAGKQKIHLTVKAATDDCLNTLGGPPLPKAGDAIEGEVVWEEPPTADGMVAAPPPPVIDVPLLDRPEVVGVMMLPPPPEKAKEKE